MILSYEEIELLSQPILQAFWGTEEPPLGPMEIYRFAKFLHLNVYETKLSDDDSILGLTTYAPTQLELCRNGKRVILRIPGDTILLSDSLRKHPKRLRFTLAHECAHQILHRYESLETQGELYAAYRPGLQTADDWNEWQANALGAALLMPAALIRRSMRAFRCETLISYGGVMTQQDHHTMRSIADSLQVSRRALEIRLRHLGYLQERPYEEYKDPLEVWNE